MAKDIIPEKDSDLLGMAKRFVSEMEQFVGDQRIASEHSTELMAAIKEFDSALEEHEKVRALVSATARAKEIKRAPLVRILRELAETANWDPRGRMRRVPDESTDPSQESIARSVDTDAPTLRLEAEPGKVLVHFGRLPGWASGVCVYRREAGTGDFKMLKFASESPYTDEITGPSAEYEYTARYWNKRQNRVGAKSETISVKASGKLVAA